MSDYPIQTNADPNAARAGEQSLSEDSEQRSRCGFTGSQIFPITGAKGTVQVDADVAARTVSPNDANGAASRPSGDVSNMNVGNGRGISVKLVNANHLEGSNKGDHRVPDRDTAAASVQEAAVGSGSPRGPVGQWGNSKSHTKLGSFGKDHADRSYPAPDNGD